MKSLIIIGVICLAVVAGGIFLIKSNTPNSIRSVDSSPTPMAYAINSPTITLIPQLSITSTPSATPKVKDISTTARPKIQFTTNKGKFVIELHPEVAPKTVANYLDKWTHNYCDGLTIHRVENWVVQGCDPAGNGTGGKDSLPTENSTESFVAGSVGVARKQYPADISNDSQFFIVKTDSTFLDGQYTWFGKVVSGMDVVEKLAINDKILSTHQL